MEQRGAIRYACSRLLSAVPTLFFVIGFAFLMMHAAPGGPFDQERRLPDDVRANIEAHYHLDEPLAVQFGNYLGGLFRADLGPSFRRVDYDVAELIGQSAPISFLLGSLAFGLALAAGIGAGVCAALHRNTLLDRFVTGAAIAGISVPVLVVAPLLALVFAVLLGVLPASWTGATDGSQLVLPVVALALSQIAHIARLVRASMIDVLGSDFIRTARAQGLRTWTVIRRHAFKPAMLPLLSYMGPAVAAILAGSVVVEEVFGIPGLGRLFVTAATGRDYTLILGIVILYATLVILLNLAVDILYGFLDPRIRNR